MSVVTEVNITIKLKHDTPLLLIQFLKNKLTHSPVPRYDNHPYFDTERWMSMFAEMSHNGYTKPYLKEVSRIPWNFYELHLHPDINYEEGEVNTFLHWIEPYILGHKPKTYVGWRRDEWHDGNDSTNLYIKKK